jgi:hypothetical protein
MVFIIGKPGLSSGFLTGQLRTDRSQAIEAEVAIEGEAVESADTEHGNITGRRCIGNDAPIEVQRSIDRRAHDAILNDSGDEEPRTSPYDFCANSVKPVTSAAP